MKVNFRVDSINSFSDVREALQKIKEAVEGSVLEKGDWNFFEITVDSAVTNLKYSHNLKYIPKDVIQISVTGGVQVTWNYASFDRTNLNLNTNGACVIRAYIGRHKEG